MQGKLASTHLKENEPSVDYQLSCDRNSSLPSSISPHSTSTGTIVAYRAELMTSLMVGRLNLMLEKERDCGIGFNLVPVGLASGIGLYFSAPQEPIFLVLCAATLLFSVISLRMRLYRPAFYLLSATAVVFVGMVAASISTYRVGTVMLERQLTSTISGVVLEVDQNRRGSPRFLLKTVRIEGLSRQELPPRIRVSAASGLEDVIPGAILTGLARLQPISGPVYPGSYDFSFHAWYEGLGGSGFFMGKPVESSEKIALTVSETITVFINQTRSKISSRIHAALPGITGGIATALITGDKTGIDASSQENLRRTGLAHILAISGLHMALVTLTMIWLVRLGFSFFPALILSYPVKKWAVTSGFIAATLYLFLSGGGIATQRAWIMISVMLLSVLIDRRAITIRSVAVSAALILLFNPQSLFAPGFQMSFAAVASLVAGYEVIRRRKDKHADGGFFTTSSGWISRVTINIGKYVMGLAITSIIAGTATGFIAAWHFHQVAVFGLLANLAAMPVVSLIIMPMVMLSVLLMPFGFEAIALLPVSWGIQTVLQIAAEVEAISPDTSIGHLSGNWLIIFGISLAGLTLFNTKLRLLFLFGPILMMAPFWQSSQPPDVLLSENGRAVGVIEDGILSLVYPKRNRFVTDIWAKAWVSGNVSPLSLSPAQCNADRCIILLSNSQVLHMVYDPDLIRSSCSRADILIAPRLWWVRCPERKPTLILNRLNFERNGSHSLYLQAQGNDSSPPLIKTGIISSTRPWVRRVSEFSGNARATAEN